MKSQTTNFWMNMKLRYFPLSGKPSCASFLFPLEIWISTLVFSSSFLNFSRKNLQQLRATFLVFMIKSIILVGHTRLLDLLFFGQQRCLDQFAHTSTIPLYTCILLSFCLYMYEITLSIKTDLTLPSLGSPSNGHMFGEMAFRSFLILP